MNDIGLVHSNQIEPTSQHGLVDTQSGSFELDDAAISGDLITHRYPDDIARHQIHRVNQLHLTVSDDGGFACLALFQSLEESNVRKNGQGTRYNSQQFGRLHRHRDDAIMCERTSIDFSALVS